MTRALLFNFGRWEMSDGERQPCYLCLQRSDRSFLVVDDTPDIATPVGMSLAAEGYRVTLAEDGAQALDRIRTETPDVVLLDLMMPFVDGWKVLSRLRTWEHGSPPVIVVSAVWSSSEKLLAQMMGAVDYVTKPFDMRDLVERVNSIMASVSVESA